MAVGTRPQAGIRSPKNKSSRRAGLGRIADIHYSVGVASKLLQMKFNISLRVVERSHFLSQTKCQW